MDRYLQRTLASRIHGRIGLVPTVLRIATAGVFLAFGIYKFSQHASELAALDRYGLPFADQLTYAIGVVETGGGVLLLLGLATRPAALVLAGDMIGAICTAGRVEGGWINLGLAPALLAAMVFLLWSGAGEHGLDDRLLSLLARHRATKLDENATAGPVQQLDLYV